MTVAEELKAIQLQAKKYVDASKRMNGIGDALEKLTLVVGRVPEQFTGFTSRANELWKLFEASKASLDNTSAAMPEVIKRIESADVFKSLSAFSLSLEKLESSMAQRMGSLADLTASLTEERKKNQEALDALNAQTNAIEARTGTIQNEILSLKEIVKEQTQHIADFKAHVSSRLNDGLGNQSMMLSELLSLVHASSDDSKKALQDMSEHAEKSRGEISAVNAGVEALKVVSQQQTLWLQQVSKKKGLFF
jgi:septal ring factor EnvC (AmiA/AmiB activator)